MGENMRLVVLGAFFVAVLGGVAFLMIQEGEEPPLRPRAPVAAGDSGGSAASGDGGGRQSLSAPPDAEVVSEALPDDVADAAPTAVPKSVARRPVGPGVVKGTVTWHGDGAPVAGATVMLDYTERAQSYEPFPEERAEWTQTTNAKGEFRFAKLPVNVVFGDQAGQLTVVAQKEGASAVSIARLTDDVTQAIVDLSLRPSGSIAGQVVDESGAPVAGAVVRPHELADEAQRRYAYGARSLWTRADGAGNFQLDHLNTGKWTLAVKSPHFADEVSEAYETGEQHAKIVLARGTTVSGTVVDANSGEPVANTFVTLLNEENRDNQVRAGTDKEGRFEAAALGDSTYEIRLDDPERVLVGQAPKISVARAAPVEGVTLMTTLGASVSGMVTDADTGAPIPGVRIRAQGNQRTATGYPEGLSDGSGYYRISGLQGGSYTLRRRWKEGYRHGESREDRSISVAVGKSLENIDFAVKRGLALSGIVVDRAGDPVEGIHVSGTTVIQNGEGENVTTTEDGRFALRGFSPNVEVTIAVSGRGYTAPQTGPLSTGESGRDDLEIVVEAGASIAGVVVDRAGKTLPNMYVTAHSADSVRGGSAGTDPEGNFEMKSLEAGTYRLMARHQNSWSSRNESDGQEVSLTKGQALKGVRVVFDGNKGITISGRVTNAKREPLKDASINANSQDGVSHAHTQTDAEGRYELGVDAGLSYSMYVHHRSHSTQQREGVEAGSRNVDFVLEGRGTLEGRVVDASTGRPIPHFEIAHHRGTARGMNYQQGNYVSFYNEDGQFSVDGVEAGGNTVYARALGYAPAMQEVPHVQADGLTGGIQFRLARGATIDGVVLDLAGAPIRGAQIYLSARVDEWMMRQGGGGGYGAVATSGVGGEFTIESIGSDLTHITAVHPDFPNTTIRVAPAEGRLTSVEIIMSGGGIIEGTAYVNGAPASELRVYALNLGGGGGQESVKTDERGFYRIERLPEGDVTVFASLQRDGGGARSHSEIVSVRAGHTTTVDLRVEIGTGAFEGLITAGGQPVTQGHVGAILLSDASDGQQQMQGTVSADGTYHVGGLSPGSYRLMVGAISQEGGLRQMRMVEAAVKDGETVRVDIELDGGSHVRGTISGATDVRRCHVAALTGNVAITDPATQFASPQMAALLAGSSTVDASGTYDIAGLSEGEYTIVVLEMGPSGYADARYGSGHVRVGASGEVTLDLALR